MTTNDWWRDCWYSYRNRHIPLIKPNIYIYWGQLNFAPPLLHLAPLSFFLKKNQPISFIYQLLESAPCCLSMLISSIYFFASLNRICPLNISNRSLNLLFFLVLVHLGFLYRLLLVVNERMIVMEFVFLIMSLSKCVC